MSSFTRADVCIVALAEAFRGDGEILASPIGLLPMAAARLAKLTFEKDLLLTDGVASLVANVTPLGDAKAAKVIEGWMPYRSIFDLVWSGRRHVIMGASQIDRFGNQNICAIGSYDKPKSMLLGMRGAPGNTINHPTSYFVPAHSTRTFVPKVDVVSGVGYDRAKALGAVARFHEIRRVVSNLGVFDFRTEERTMRLFSLHPGVTVDDVKKATGFPLVIPEDVVETRVPTDEELRLLREVIDPKGIAQKEIAA
jgi:acyl CoA:acetate/3-ketoacid CoA transferase beta subunit